MKTLLFLPLIILLTACTLEASVEELQAKETKKLIDQSMEIFKYNEAMLEDEILFGEVCLMQVKKSGVTKGEACDMYYLIHDTTTKLSQEGVKLIFVLANGGLLAKDAPYFVEVLEIIERLSVHEREAGRIGTKIAEYTGTNCVKCAM